MGRCPRAVAVLAFQANENRYRDFPAESRIVATACGQRPRLRVENKDGSLKGGRVPSVYCLIGKKCLHFCKSIVFKKLG